MPPRLPFTLPALVFSLGMASMPAIAALEARDLDGNRKTTEAFYDTVLDITWLADANAPRTLGVDDDGALSFEEAVGFVASLDVNGVVGWRLPTVKPVNGTGFRYGVSYDGSTDRGYNITSPQSELAHLFHVTLGNLSRFDTAGNLRAGDAGVDWGLVNYGPFRNLDVFEFPTFWTGVTDGRNPTQAWFFYAYNGIQNVVSKDLPLGVWAVRDGDVAQPIPEPGTWALMAIGLAGVAVAARRRGRYTTR